MRSRGESADWREEGPGSYGGAVGTSLWLVPEDSETSRRLAELIDSLARRFGTPRFDPHLTLLGGLDAPAGDVIARSQSLAATIPPLELRVLRVEGTEEYFRCVFAAVEDTRELIRARERALEALVLNDTSRFFPHISLVYGHLSESVKGGLLRELQEWPIGTMVSRELRVVSTEGPPERWQRVAAFGFLGG